MSAYCLVPVHWEVVAVKVYRHGSCKMSVLFITLLAWSLSACVTYGQVFFVTSAINVTVHFSTIQTVHFSTIQTVHFSISVLFKLCISIQSKLCISVLSKWVYLNAVRSNKNSHTLACAHIHQRNHHRHRTASSLLSWVDWNRYDVTSTKVIRLRMKDNFRMH